MANRLRRLLTKGAAALILCLSLVQTASARPDIDIATMRAGLSEIASLLAREPLASNNVLAQLVFSNGLKGILPLAPPVVVTEERADLPLATTEVVDFRPILALLSQGRSPEDNASVLDAQGVGGPQALAFRNGRVTGDHLRAALNALGPGAYTLDGAIRVPILLWQDTVLQLGPADRLALSRPDGAFIVSLGIVEIVGSTIGVAGAPNPRSPVFAPFLAVAGGGQLVMQGATLQGLGFGWSDKFAGVSVLRHPFMPASGRSQVSGSRFDKVVSLVLGGTPGVEVVGNRFRNMRGNAVRVGLAPDARIVGNLFSGNTPTNAVRVLDKSNGTLVAQNLVLSGTLVGIVVNGGSAFVTVRDNVLWDRNGGGIKFRDTQCGLVINNLVLDNRQKGIEVYASPGTRILRNRIEGNRNAALWISGQPKNAVTEISGNVLRGNGTGLSTATAARLWLDSNDFSKQLPRLVGGDIAFRNADLVRDLYGRTPMVLSAARVSADDMQPNDGCGPQEEM